MQSTAAKHYPIGFAGRTNAVRVTRRSAALFLDRTIFYGLLALTAIAAVPYGTVQPWWEAFYQCGVFALTIFWTIECWLKGGSRIDGKRMLLPLLALFLFALAQTLIVGGAGAGQLAGAGAQPLSFDPFETKRAALKLLALAFTLGLLLNHTRGKHRLRRLIHVVLGIGIASALFGMLRQVVNYFAPAFDLPQLAQNSSYAQFINANHFAFLMEMVLGLVAGLLLSNDFRRRRLSFYLLAGSVMWIALVLSRSRGGILGMLSGAVILVALLGTVRLSIETEARSGVIGKVLQRLHSSLALRAVVAFCLLVILVTGVWWVGGSPVVSRLKDVPTEFASDNVSQQAKTRRIEMWRATLPLIRENWLVGVGFGAYWVAITEHHRASGNFTLYQAHNDYLELAASGGLIGLLLAALFAFAFVSEVRRRFRQSHALAWNPVRCGALAGLFAVAVHSMVDFGLHITINAVVFVALLAIASIKDPETPRGDKLTSDEFSSVRLNPA